jgi:hypothetical protein
MQDITDKLNTIFRGGVIPADISDIYYQYHKDDHIYVKSMRKYYRRDRNNLFVVDDKGKYLGKAASKCVRENVDSYIRTTYGNRSVDEKTQKNYERLVNYCGDKKGINAMINYLKSCYYESDFSFSNDDNVFAFNNGIFDINKKTFKRIDKEYYLKNTGSLHYYLPTDDAVTNKIAQIHSLLNVIFVDNKVKRYSLVSIAECLTGRTKLDSYYIWLGNTNNKLLITKLIAMVFGSYYSCIDPKYFRSTRKMLPHDKTMEALINCRIVITDELTQSMPINYNKIRAIYKNHRITYDHTANKYYNPKYKLIISIASDVQLVNINDYSPSVKDCMNVIRFSDEEIETDIFDGDDDVTTLAFFNILLDNYHSDVTNKYISYPPDKIKADTIAYCSM